MYNNIDPLYKQVQEILLKNIEIGIWPIHSKIPDEITLSEQLKISASLSELMATIIPLFSIPLTKASRPEAPMTIQISSTFSERNVQKNPAFSSANTSPGASSPPVRTKYFIAVPQNSALTPIFLKNCELLELKLLLQNNFLLLRR